MAASAATNHQQLTVAKWHQRNDMAPALARIVNGMAKPQQRANIKQRNGSRHISSSISVCYRQRVARRSVSSMAYIKHKAAIATSAYIEKK